MKEEILTPEEINKLYDGYIEELTQSEKHIKYHTSYSVDDQLTRLLEEIKEKEVIL